MAGSIVRRTAEALPNGYTLHGKYVIKGVLGQGGFGITYIANDLNGGRRVALKELYPSEIVRRVQKVMVVAKPGCEAAFEKIKSSFSKETMITIWMNDGTINGEECDILCANREIPPGYKAMCQIYPASYDLSSIDAEEILELAGAIQFRDEAYKTISTVSVTFYFEPGDWPI